MKTPSVIIITLLVGISTIPVSLVQSYSNSMTLQEGVDPPIIISQVELDSSFKFLSNNDTCSSQHVSYPDHSCLTDLVPDRKVECAYFFSKTCEPIHQYTSGTNKTCIGIQNGGVSNAPQWFDLYNTQDKSIQIQYFDVKMPNTSNTGISEDGPYYSMPAIGPHEKCSFAFSPINQAMSIDPKNRTITISYDYNDKHYTVSTPPLTDTYNDSKTWQFDGNQWIFVEQNTMSIPEFPYVTFVLITSIISLIIFYRMKFK